MQVKNLLLSFVFIFSSACCSNKFHVNVNSLVSEGGVARKKYLLLPGNGNISLNDLLFREFSSYVTNALAVQGYKPAKNMETADLAIFLSYGVGNPRDYQYIYSFPVWDSDGRTERIKTFKPSYGIKGYSPYGGSYARNFRFIFLDAYDLRLSRDAGEPVQVWETSITSGGSSDDLRMAFPVLLAAAREYIGVNTGRTIEYIMDSEDPRITDITGGDGAIPESNWREDFRSRMENAALKGD